LAFAKNRFSITPDKTAGKEGAMTDREVLLHNRLADLEERLRIAESKYDELAGGLQLNDREREILEGREDGTIPLGLVRPILRRVFGEQLLRKGA
jgi:hypothetical protein